MELRHRIIDTNTAEDYDGNIVHPYELGFSEEEAQAIAKLNEIEKANIIFRRSQEYPKEELIAQARTQDFTERNEAIEEVARLMGQSNRDIGAFSLWFRNISTDHHIKGQDTSYERSQERNIRAKAMGQKACDACALALFCDEQTRTKVFDELSNMGASGRQARRRLSARTQKDNFETNDHFCLTNIKDKRLKKSRA